MSDNAINPEFPKRRILCIDGGGILGTFPAAFLTQIEKHLDEPIGSYFDLIVGTSTGGILAIGLSLGLTAEQLLNLYKTHGPEIFGQQHGRFINFTLKLSRRIRNLYRKKYDSNNLQSVLEKTLGNKRIGNAKTRLIVPAWNPVARSVYIYKTAHHPRLKTDYKSLVVDAALATSAAPTYFKQHITDNDVGLIDGGIWANNPIAIAVVEALTLLGWHRSSLHVLSLGCLEETYTIKKWAGLGTLGSKVVNLFMDGQSHSAMGIAKLLTGDQYDRQAIYRINHVVPRKAYKMDDVSTIQDLEGLGFTKARESLPILENIFFDHAAEAFNPVYSLSEVN